VKTQILVATVIATALFAQLSLADPTDQKQRRDNSAADPPNSGIHAAKLIGSDVKSNDGENLGKVEDLVIDPRTGRVTFAIVSKGGILKLGEKRMPVPWQAVTVDAQKRITLNVDKEKLRTAPTTARSDDSELENPDFAIVVYKFYEIEPASGTGAPGETPGATGRGASQSQPSGAEKGASQSQPNPDTSKP
jgi:sporulation protein YlmC with PRC-barrel domain